MKLTQEGLAEALGTSSAWVSQVERGVGSPSVDTLVKIAAALKTTPTAIVEAAWAQPGLSATVRELLAVAQRLSPAAARVLVESARAMEREGLAVAPSDGD